MIIRYNYGETSIPEVPRYVAPKILKAFPPGVLSSGSLANDVHLRCLVALHCFHHSHASLLSKDVRLIAKACRAERGAR